MKNVIVHLQDEDGSGLVSVLSFIVIFTVLAGVVLSVESLQYQFIHRDVARLQARYQAEAGVYGMMQLLQNNPFLEVSDTLLVFEEGVSSLVSTEAVGGYYQIRSTSGTRDDKKRGRFTVLAVVAEQPPAAFNNAVYMWDNTSRLNVAGTTTIHGDVEVGKPGIRQQTIAGIRYTGALNGVSRYNPAILPPDFDDHFLQRAVARMDQMISTHGEGTFPSAVGTDYEPAFWLPFEFPVYFVDGDLLISRADSVLLSLPHMIVATGDLHLQGPLMFAAGTHFLAGKRLYIHGQIMGERGLFYGRQLLTTQGATLSKGQFFSRQDIVIKDSAYIAHPSLLFLGGTDEAHTGKIEIEGRAIVEGNIIHSYLPETPREVRGRIIVGKESLVRGGIYNPYSTELHGTVHGSVLTHRFFFYRSPTRYVNWLFDANVDRHLRPIAFFVPLLFEANPGLEVVSWEVVRPGILSSNPSEEVAL